MQKKFIILSIFALSLSGCAAAGGLVGQGYTSLITPKASIEVCDSYENQDKTTVDFRTKVFGDAEIEPASIIASESGTRNHSYIKGNLRAKVEVNKGIVLKAECWKDGGYYPPSEREAQNAARMRSLTPGQVSARERLTYKKKVEVPVTPAAEAVPVGKGDNVQL